MLLLAWLIVKLPDPEDRLRISSLSFFSFASKVLAHLYKSVGILSRTHIYIKLLYLSKVIAAQHDL